MEMLLNLFKKILKIFLYFLLVIGFIGLLYSSYKASRHSVKLSVINNRVAMYLFGFDFDKSFTVLLVIFVVLLVGKLIVDYFMKKSASKDGFSDLYEGMFSFADRYLGERSSLIEALMFILSIALVICIYKWNCINKIMYFVLSFPAIFVKMYFNMPIYKDYSLKTKMLCVLSYILFLALLFMLVIPFGFYFSAINLIILIVIIVVVIVPSGIPVVRIVK